MPKVFSDVLFCGCIYATGEAYRDKWDRLHGDFEDGPPLKKCSADDPQYAAGVVIASVLPFWLRLMQSVRAYRDHGTARERVRHVANGAKYCCSIATVALSFVSPWSRVWLVVSCISTLYSLGWDVLVDWGLGPAWVRRRIHGPAHGGASAHAFLRPALGYKAWWYYAALLLNSCARVGWAIYISPGQRVVQAHVILLLGCVELGRRAQWALFRLEWEQIVRVGKQLELEARARGGAGGEARGEATDSECSFGAPSRGHTPGQSPGKSPAKTGGAGGAALHALASFERRVRIGLTLGLSRPPPVAETRELSVGDALPPLASDPPTVDQAAASSFDVARERYRSGAAGLW
jgi:hypothetical protein